MDDLHIRLLEYSEDEGDVTFASGPQRYPDDDNSMRRIVASWNACQGIDTKSLEIGKTFIAVIGQEGELHTQRDALLTALRQISGHDPDTCPGITPRDCLETVREIARAALAIHEPPDRAPIDLEELAREPTH